MRKPSEDSIFKMKRHSKKNPKSKIQNPKIIILFGPPGSGKGTQAELLAEKFNFYHWETSKIIGKIIEETRRGESVKVQGKKYYFEKEKQLRKEGKLWDPPFVAYLIKEKLNELAKEKKGIVLAGSPRTVYEGERVIPLLKRLYGVKNIKVVLIKLSEKESLWRNSHRKECELIRHSILYTKETAKLTKCPFDGSKLDIRKDDTPETIKIRLKEYKRQTYPVVALFARQGLRIKNIDGEQSVANVFKDILRTVKSST